MNRGRAILVEVVLAGLIVLAANAFLTRDAVDGLAPALPAATLNAKNAHVEQGAAGRPMLVDFFATWCPICRVDQSVAQDLARHAQVVVVATQSPRQAVLRFAKSHHWRTPVILDPKGRIAKRFGVHVLPMAFVLGPRRHIRFVVAGYTTEAGLLARVWLASLHL